MSTKTNITPTKKPSTISLVSIALIYSIPNNPVTNIVIIGTTMLILRTFAVKSGLNMDERTTDGYYWASSLKVFKNCMAHPEILKNKPETVIKDF